MNVYNTATSVVDWSEKYHNSFLITDDVLDFAGKLLNLVAQSIGAKRILEILQHLDGRALPHDGTLITLEIDPLHAKVAKKTLRKLDSRTSAKSRLVLPPNLTNLHPDVPFDLIFIDADKKSYPKYFAEAKRLVKKGGVIQVSDMSVNDVNSVGAREMLAALKEDKEIEATTIATVSERAFDGFMYAIRKYCL
ncbi:hypothetical protein BT96DRAFT_998811 [Gymnopus androsaceus JB14]|uniref:S-adenosyl-L-methionine-dependent methyltransferase n=1 Tax=Gymnopus androsaceus JB14 TaxID=1447944 RepID=A0A6A4H8U9_9AGAR|nr:hypothetical protein BT96DRAFT_998811 [Gymnopus androsaceus JB14]